MINFERSSITNPVYTAPGVTFLSLKSSNLKGRGEISIYLPEKAKGSRDLPFIILLHGVYGSHFSWLYQAGVHLVLDKMMEDKLIGPFMLVMPSDGLRGDGSGYLPHRDRDYEKWIIEDVFAAINFHFNEITPKSPAFISGLSMGGFGALRLGMKFHDIFSGISAHSAITDLDDYQTFIEEDYHEFLDDRTIGTASVIDTALKNRHRLPPFRFDCGHEDRLIDSNRRLHQALITKGIDHVYEEFSGEHNYAYWTTHIGNSFIFFQQLLTS